MVFSFTNTQQTFFYLSDMVETVKHAIVLLQIAKNASCPGTQEGSTDEIARVHGAEKVVGRQQSSI